LAWLYAAWELKAQPFAYSSLKCACPRLKTYEPAITVPGDTSISPDSMVVVPMKRGHYLEKGR
jgi:hypothetical protein